MNRTETIRKAMKPGLFYSTDTLSLLTEIPKSRITALLKHDIEQGRIIKNDKYPRLYRLATGSELSAPRIQQAISLLLRSGYTVTNKLGEVL